MSDQNERAARILIVNEVTKALDLMQRHYETFCRDNNVKSVPMDYIKNEHEDIQGVIRKRSK